MAGFKYLEGALKARFDVTGAGGTTRTLAKSLQGTADVAFSDGAIRGIDIADVYNNLVSLMSSGFKQDGSKATTFTELAASLAIEGGVARSEDIKLVGPLVRMSGNGAADLAERTLNFRLEPRLVASLQGQGAEISTDGIGVPVVVEGSFRRAAHLSGPFGPAEEPRCRLGKAQGFRTAHRQAADRRPHQRRRRGRRGEGPARRYAVGMRRSRTRRSSTKTSSSRSKQIIGGDAAPKPDKAAVEIPLAEEPATADAPTEQPANAGQEASEEAGGPMEGFFKQLLR
jgi:AsmA protein